MKHVNYELFGQETFFIEPTNQYDELFYKFPKYKYQLEARICLIEMKFDCIFDRHNMQIGPLPPNDYRMTHDPLYMQLEIVTEQKQ